MCKYPILERELAGRGVKKKAIAQALDITQRSLSNKLMGRSPITWPEACKIQKRFFPDVPKDELFSTDHGANSAPTKAG